jgi:hypothetical protein
MKFEIDDPRETIKSYTPPVFEDQYVFTAQNDFGNPTTFFIRSTVGGMERMRFMTDDHAGNSCIITDLELSLENEPPKASFKTFSRTGVSADFGIFVSTISKYELERAAAYFHSFNTHYITKRALKDDYDSESIFWFHSPPFGSNENKSQEDRIEQLLEEHERWVQYQAKKSKSNTAQRSKEPATKPPGCASMIILLFTLTPAFTFGVYHLLRG